MIHIDIDAIIARIATLKADGTVNDVAGLGDISQAPENTTVTDSVFVFPPSKAGGQNNAGTMMVNQPVTAQIGVAIVFLNVTGGGPQMTSHIQAVCNAVEDVVFAWSPGLGLSPFTLVSARAEEVNPDKGYLIYAFVFQTSYRKRKP